MTTIKPGPIAHESCHYTLIQKLQSRQAVAAVIGLGFIGLSEAVALAKSGVKVISRDQQP